MGLLSIIKKQKQKDKEIRCLVIGLDNSGKSTIVNQLLPQQEREKKITPTIGFQIKSFAINNTYNVNLWDVGGQSSLRPFWENYFTKTDVLMWCIDASLEVRFDESFQELRSLIMNSGDRIGYECHVIIVLNKIDLLDDSENNLSSLLKQFQTRVLSRFEAESSDNRTSDVGFNPEDNISFVSCSAITGTGIEALKEAITADVTR